MVIMNGSIPSGKPMRVTREDAEENTDQSSVKPQNIYLHDITKTIPQETNISVVT